MNKPIEINQEEPNVEITYYDKIVKLIDGTTLIGRMLVFDETIDDDEDFELHFHSPMEIWYDYDGNVQLHKWIKHSDDIVYTIPMMNILNISTPERMIGIMYANGFIFDDEHADFTTDLSIPDVVH